MNSLKTTPLVKNTIIFNKCNVKCFNFVRNVN